VKELTFTPIHELAPKIESKELSPSKLVHTYLESIRAIDDKLHSFIDIYAHEALSMAEATEIAINSGHYLGPLHGIPVALKDLIEIANRRTTAGSLFWKDRISSITATVVNKLSAAGAIILGKTHMPEFAFGGWGTNATMGTPWNPWDLTVHRNPGGSSSGSAVAVAAGMVPASLGTDSGGSIRIPSSMCGIVGLKTTAGRVSNHGLILLSPTLDSIGPMTRSVEDAAIIFQVIHGPDFNDCATIGIPQTNVINSIKRGIEGMNIAVPQESDLGDLAPDVENAFQIAVDKFRTLGARIKEVAISFNEYHLQTGTILSAEGYAMHRNWIEQPDAPFDPNVRERLLSGKNISAADYIRILQTREKARQLFAEMKLGFAAILTPATPITAIPVTEIDESITPFSRLTRVVNYLGLCALVLPCGFTDNGLPISLQIIGGEFDEATILRTGWAYEQSTDWHLKKPKGLIP
jgi:aspartyl-tRNA(Asn)/glutamyl-tRNA(Gln) amidotransferase subunit A